jgi:carboxypeptidase Q
MKKTTLLQYCSTAVVLLTVSCASNQKPPTVEKKTAPSPTAATEAAAPISTNQPTARAERRTSDPIARIREEGLNHSQVMETLSFLTDVIGPRLTGSPGMKHANEWTRAKLESWGMENAHLEAWGPFGRGWSLQRFSAHVTQPQYIQLKAYPSAWSPGLSRPLEADVVFFDATNNTQLEKFKGKLKGAIVLAGGARPVPARFEAPARRYESSNLLVMANAPIPTSSGEVVFPRPTPTPPAQFADQTANVTNSVSTNRPSFRGRGGAGWTRFLPFLTKEGAAVILVPSTIGDAGTIFVQSASVPDSDGETNNATTGGRRGGAAAAAAARPSAYSMNAPAFPAQVTVAVEDYNRLARMAKLGEKIKMSVDLQAQYHTDDLMAYNTIAEIPGTDLKDEVVMVGAHMDSWHSGTGATDNGTGVAAAMEALRIIKTLDLKPRRTIRVALWSGEEQGLLGSRAYVSNHFGYFTTNRVSANEGSSTNRSRGGRRELVKKPEHEKFNAYFNLDNGAGKIRGVYMQGNESVRPYFRKWLEPFRDLGAETLTPSNTGSTDHVSFSGVGLPGFQFIQDPLDYGTRTHHSNEDVFDRIQPDDLKQAATIMAAFVYNAAMMEEKLPRLAVE